MRTFGLALLGLLLAGCGLLVPAPTPIPPPPIPEARALLDDIIDAGLAADFERLCGMASGTCDSELEHVADRPPTEPPTVIETTVHEPRPDGDGWSSGGVLFVLCGTDGAGDPYESEVLVFDAGDRLLAAGAVFWAGTGIILGGPPVDVGGEPTLGPDRCR